jgi:hypothetical protein
MAPILVGLFFIILYFGATMIFEKALKDAEAEHKQRLLKAIKEEYVTPKVKMIYRKGFIAGMEREREIIRQKAEELRKAKEK